MSKNLEEFKIGFQTFIRYYLIPVLENFEEKIEVLSEKVEKLEQEGNYYPRTEKEIKNIKVGLND